MKKRKKVVINVMKTDALGHAHPIVMVHVVGNVVAVKVVAQAAMVVVMMVVEVVVWVHAWQVVWALVQEQVNNNLDRVYSMITRRLYGKKRFF